MLRSLALLKGLLLPQRAEMTLRTQSRSAENAGVTTDTNVRASSILIWASNPESRETCAEEMSSGALKAPERERLIQGNLAGPFANVNYLVLR